MLRVNLAEIMFSGTVSAILGSLYGFENSIVSFEDYDYRDPEWHPADHASQDDEVQTDLDALDWALVVRMVQTSP